MESAALFVHLLNVCRNSITFPLRSLFTRTEQHLSQPTSALRWERLSPYCLLLSSLDRAPALRAPLFLDQLAVRHVGGATGWSLWNRTAVLHLLSFTAGHRVETVTQQVTLPPLGPARVYRLVAQNCFLKSLWEPLGSWGIWLHAHGGNASVFIPGMNGRLW